MDQPAARHLVAARIASKAADEPAALLSTLIEGLCPNADFALLTRCEEDCAVTLCAFATPRDAERLAAAVGAGEADIYPEWASQRCFDLDEATVHAIAETIEWNAVAPFAAQHNSIPHVQYAHH